MKRQGYYHHQNLLWLEDTSMRLSWVACLASFAWLSHSPWSSLRFYFHEDFYFYLIYLWGFFFNSIDFRGGQDLHFKRGRGASSCKNLCVLPKDILTTSPLLTSTNNSFCNAEKCSYTFIRTSNWVMPHLILKKAFQGSQNFPIATYATGDLEAAD